MKRRVAFQVALIVLGGMAAFFAFAFRDARIGSLPAGASPMGVLGAVTAVCFALAAVSVWSGAGKRMDDSFLADREALLVAGAQTDLKLKQALTRLSGSVVKYLPTRVTLVATNDGIELWGRPGRSRYACVPWGDILHITTARLVRFRSSAGLVIEVSDSRSNLEIVIAGTDVTGLPTTDFSRVQALASDLERLRREAIRN